jgi:hypothetical protein
MRFFASGTYDLFLTHAWYYTDEWQALVALLDDFIPGKWRNWSLPWHDTSIDRHSARGRVQLDELLDGQISMAELVLVLPETARTNDGRMWLDKQLELSARHRKPILGVLAAESGEFPANLRPRVIEVVPRNATEIVRAVERFSASDRRVGAQTRG